MDKKDLRLAQIIEYILDYADDLLKEKKEPVIYGERIASAEALTIIQEALDENERKLYGLDFDIDKKYL